ncbi:MAG: FtsW/RodA/SpoVE family cell cycle protein [Kiritimatiellae bacterium]|nr:FtsW/RodA/SpoVE family cell cycle protein [Kiritimatiellia bacterium]
MIFSATELRCGSGDLFQFVKKQGIAIGAGLIAALFFYLFDYRLWKKYWKLSLFFYIVVIVLLALPLFGDGVKGSKRWIEYGGFSFQPSELAKFASILLTATYISIFGWKINTVKVFLLWYTAILACAGLIVLEPDYGAGLIFLALAFLTMYVGSLEYKFLIPSIFVPVAVIAVIVCCFDDNRIRRIREATQDGSYSHQQNAALVAIQEGGLYGVGYNASNQKWGWLPEAHTDYIFSIGAEELGLLRFTIPVILLFLMILFFGLRIAYLVPDKHGKMIAYGMTVLIVGQAGFNFCVIAGWGFSKGIALPFISYGGSNVIIALSAIGAILNVSRQNTLQNKRIRSKILKTNFKRGGK